jgi:hypothetical protein
MAWVMASVTSLISSHIPLQLGTFLEGWTPSSIRAFPYRPQVDTTSSKAQTFLLYYLLPFTPTGVPLLPPVKNITVHIGLMARILHIGLLLSETIATTHIGGVDLNMDQQPTSRLHVCPSYVSQAGFLRFYMIKHNSRRFLRRINLHQTERNSGKAIRLLSHRIAQVIMMLMIGRTPLLASFMGLFSPFRDIIILALF